MSLRGLLFSYLLDTFTRPPNRSRPAEITSHQRDRHVGHTMRHCIASDTLPPDLILLLDSHNAAVVTLSSTSYPHRRSHLPIMRSTDYRVPRSRPELPPRRRRTPSTPPTGKTARRSSSSRGSTKTNNAIFNKLHISDCIVSPLDHRLHNVRSPYRGQYGYKYQFMAWEQHSS